jgi:DNA-binding LytR/AlgR family response regulator
MAAALNSIYPWRKTVSAQPLRLLLADDEPLALRRIKLALQAIPDVEVVGAASDGAQAITQMRDLKPDVVLLDIKMPLADGFEVANAVEDSGGPEVIFVSAFDSYAVQAFETSAVDYLVKPVEFERLASALGRARERRAAKDAGRRAEELAAVLDALKKEAEEREGPRYEKEFWIRDRGRFLRVPVSDVERIEAERDYVRLYWEGPHAAASRDHVSPGREARSELDAARSPLGIRELEAPESGAPRCERAADGRARKR